MKTFIPKIDPNARNWVLVDLEGATLGKAAIKVANVLRGKNRPIFTPHLDCGDNVVAINASGLKVTGDKMLQKKYYRYSGYPGGLKERTMAQQMVKDPTRVFQAAVKGMLPKNRLGRKMAKKLHIYPGNAHPHTAQRPEKMDI